MNIEDFLELTWYEGYFRSWFKANIKLYYQLKSPKSKLKFTIHDKLITIKKTSNKIVRLLIIQFILLNKHNLFTKVITSWNSKSSSLFSQMNVYHDFHKSQFFIYSLTIKHYNKFAKYLKRARINRRIVLTPPDNFINHKKKTKNISTNYNNILWT